MLPRDSVATRSSVPATLVVFRYEGETPIVVIGRITGTRYRFAGRGAEVAVDVRDRPSVRQVPRVSEVVTPRPSARQHVP